MASVILSIGANSAAVTPASGTVVAGGYDVTFTTTPTGAQVGDVGLIDDEPIAASYVFLLTAINGSTYTFKYISGGLGTENPYGMTDISFVQSVMTVQRAYTNPNTWEAGLDDTDYYAAGDDAYGYMYDDGAATAGSPVTIDGGGTVGLNSIVLTVPEGHRHDGTAGTGLVYKPAGTGACITIGGTVYTEILWLDLDCSGMTVSTGTRGIDCGGSGGYMISHDIIHDRHESGLGDVYGVLMAGTSAAGAMRGMHNCLVYDFTSTADNTVIGVSVDGVLHDAVTPKTVRVYNNTVFNIQAQGATRTAEGFKMDSNDSRCKNGLAVNINNSSGVGETYEKCFNDPNARSLWQNNGGEDTTATGLDPSASVDGNTAANTFVSTVDGSEDLRLASGSKVIDKGQDVSTALDGILDDVGSENRAGKGPWDIGAFSATAALIAWRKHILDLALTQTKIQVYSPVRE